MSNENTARNRAIAIEAITGVFIKRDTNVPEELFDVGYKQHNPAIPNGSSAIPELIRSLPAEFKYEMGMVIAEGEFVAIHGRYTGWAAKPLIAVDIFRIFDGKLVEHWDVMQEEVPANNTVSGNAMFVPPEYFMTPVVSRSPMSPPCVASEVHTGVDLQCLTSDRRSILLLTVLGSSMAFMDGSVINVALPTLQASFRASSYHILWVVQAYSLLGSALLLFCGALGDRFGRTRIYLLGVAVFALASVGCAASFNLSELILARAIQGFGAALLIPQALAILSDTYPEGERAGAIGTWSAWTSVSIALGPIVGGWLIQISGWRAIFLLNIPFTLWIIWLAPKLRRKANDQPPVTSFPLDYRGATLNILGFAAIVFALSFVPQLGWKDPRISLSLLIGFVLLFVFVLSQRRSPNPLVPLSLFRSAAFSGANVLTFLAYGALGGAFYIVPYFLIGARHLLPSSAGAAFLPMIAIMFAFSGRVGTIAAKVGEVKFMVVGSALTAVGFALLGLVSKETRYAFGFLPGVLLLGVGITLTVAPLTSFLMSSVVASRRGVASAVNNSVSRLGGLIAVSIVAVAVSHTFNLELGRQLQSSGLTAEMQHILVNSEGLMLDLPIPQQFGYSQTLRAKAIVQHSFVTAYRDVMFGCAFTTFLGTLVIVWTAGKSQFGLESSEG